VSITLPVVEILLGGHFAVVAIHVIVSLRHTVVDLAFLDEGELRNRKAQLLTAEQVDRCIYFSVSWAGVGFASEVVARLPR
jgi:succinate dehydrogenase/fumarate reductase cytochrome b subunit